MKRSDRCIATSCDSKYFPALIAFLRSLKHTNPNIPVVVFDGGITKRQSKKIEKFAELIKKRPFVNIRGKGKFSYIGQTTLLKLEASTLDYQKVLYIDVDAVVLKNLDELFSFPEGTVGVVKEVNMVKNMFRPKDRERLAASLDIDWDVPGFNAGVFAIRPSEWRSLKLKAKELIDCFGENVFSKSKDQQLLNILFQGKTYDFPGEYNFSPFYDSGKYPPAIIHYLTKCKPWHFDYPEGYNYRQYRSSISALDYPKIFIVDAYRFFKKLSGLIKIRILRRREASPWSIDPRIKERNKNTLKDQKNVQTVS